MYVTIKLEYLSQHFPIFQAFTIHPDVYIHDTTCYLQTHNILFMVQSVQVSVGHFPGRFICVHVIDHK